MLAVAETLVQNIRRDELEGVVMPHNWEFTLLSSGSKRNFDVGAVIDRYDKRMATSFLAYFIFLGQGTTGSFVLLSDKTSFFSLAVGTYLDIICDVFNKQGFKGMSDYPKMTHADIEDANIAKFGDFIAHMVDKGIIIPDAEL